MASIEKELPNISLEDNLKKALTELLLLHLLSQREYYIGELTATLYDQSGGALKIVFPYSAIYRLQKTGLIYECEKRVAPDGRRRQYFRITEQGQGYYRQLLQVYRSFSAGADNVLAHTHS